MVKIVRNTLMAGCIVLPFFQVNALENRDIDQEIGRIRKELASITAQRRAVKENVEKDYSEHSKYLESIKHRFKAVRSENDSLGKQRITARGQNDSLEALVRSEKMRQRQYDLMQNSFRNQLVVLSEDAQNVTESMPPLIAIKFTPTLGFLKSELTAKNIDNIEGMQRLFQILKDLDDQTTTIQISSGESPVPEIRGTVYLLRIGTLYEGVVDAKGLRYALWTGVDSTGAAQWAVYNDAEWGSKLLKAVNIREGKALPGFAQLPFPNKKVYKK